jgi:hypothetical protein
MIEELVERILTESKDDPMQLETPVLATGDREVTS